MGLTSKIDSGTESMTVIGVWRLGYGGIKQNGKRTHGHGQHCGECRGRGRIRGLNGNGKVQ